MLSTLLTVLLFMLPPSANSQGNPTLPYESPGLCPFECCTYSDKWVAEKNLQVLSARNPKAPVAFTVKKGEKITGVTGVVVTLAWGKAKGAPPQKNSGKRILQPGETVDVISSLGEGCYRVWKKGKIVEPCSEDVAEPVELPKAEWWVNIKNAKGQTGWVNWPAGEDYFSGVDACG